MQKLEKTGMKSTDEDSFVNWKYEYDQLKETCDHLRSHNRSLVVKVNKLEQAVKAINDIAKEEIY